MPFRLFGNWNGDGIKLHTLWKFFETRDIDLRKEDVLIRWNEDGNWDFFGKPKPEPKIEEKESEIIDPEKPLIESEIKPKKEKPLCSKCGARHWPMHKCRWQERRT